MKKHFSGLLAALALVTAQIPAITHAEEPELHETVPATHTVVKGDTLWDIAGSFLKNPWMWPEIWHVNAQISNPHLIYPGDLIRLIYMDGKPRLTLDTSGRVFKLSPKARVLSQEEAIETIPLDAINAFLSRSRMVTDDQLEGAPYVLAGMDEHLIVGAGDRLYARGTFEEGSRVYGVYRRGESFVDPDTGEKLGVLAEDMGTAELMTSERDISTLKVVRSTEEIRAGDRMLRHEERAIESTFYPSAPESEVKGVILAVEKGLHQVGNLDVVVINRGEREGIAPGTVMAIYKRGGKIRDRVTGESVLLPDERAGVLMVFRVFDKVSLGLVLEAYRGISVSDYVQNP
ncbi:LysM peptidoglycan-binding domain-containing protein [Teredinibacter franksiae]|uniref:LysM peptidoglycan-binding domain-containing protein n=1 Tax=Teredinibacter franksiae TaxID=2761453 RepID=UPI001627E0EA|nr:LysM peptidoglycan-binding domain-containing protein [Teredinibacter franksiae]